MDILDEKCIVRGDEIPDNVGEKFTSLLHHVATIVQFKDDVEKDNQSKNLKIMELERALLQREINNPVAAPPSDNMSEMRDSKMPGKIRTLDKNS